MCRRSAAARSRSASTGWQRYVEAGARHLVLRIGALEPGRAMLAEQLLSALRSLAPSE